MSSSTDLCTIRNSCSIYIKKMKTIKVLIALIFSIGLLYGTSSCAVFVPGPRMPRTVVVKTSDPVRAPSTHHDNGKHKGHYKK